MVVKRYLINVWDKRQCVIFEPSAEASPWPCDVDLAMNDSGMFGDMAIVVSLHLAVQALGVNSVDAS